MVLFRSDVGKRADVYLVIGILYGKMCFELIYWFCSTAQLFINLKYFCYGEKNFCSVGIDAFGIGFYIVPVR